MNWLYSLLYTSSLVSAALAGAGAGAGAPPAAAAAAWHPLPGPGLGALPAGSGDSARVLINELRMILSCKPVVIFAPGLRESWSILPRSRSDAWETVAAVSSRPNGV
jgi:hypothetical protein